MTDYHHRLRLEVVTPSGQALKTDADAVDLTSVMGEFEVLPGHLPVLVALKCGPFRWRQGAKIMRAALGEGFAEARPDTVIVLADKFLAVEQIDVAAATEELASAEGRIGVFKGDPTSTELKELARDRDWARTQVDVAAER